MLIVVTKAQIIDALENEPIEQLRPGAWFGTAQFPSQLPFCARCAVGSVLSTLVQYEEVRTAARQLVRTDDTCPDFPLSSLAELEVAAIKLIEKSPMAALSYFFEGACTWHSGEEVSDYMLPADVELARRDTVKFVQQRFPDSMLLDIVGVHPREGVETRSYPDTSPAS